MKTTLYVSDTLDGWHNLATDEYLLDRVAPDEVILYFYINGSAVIIGAGQNPWIECDLQAMARDGVQLVRRITGGGAVYHDTGNLNFSFICGEALYSVERQTRLVLDTVRDLGIPCEASGRNDLLADGRKFSGNAFCARGGARQHHGTLLIASELTRLGNYLNVDPRKLRAKGTKSVRSRVCNLSDFVPGLDTARVLEAMKARFAANYAPYEEPPLPTDAELAPYLEKQRSEEWRLGRTPVFDAEIENRFVWGNVQLLMTLRHGVIDALDVYSDALDADLPGEVRTLLMGCAYDAAAMADALDISAKDQIRELAEYIRGMSL